jgi:hypothetical protein
MWIEIDDDLFLPREAVVGLQFPDAAEFQRCQALLWSDALADCYREVSPLSLVVVVRKSDLPRIAAAGLSYSTFEWSGADNAAVPEADDERTSALIARWMPVFVKRLQRKGPPARQ